MGGSEYNRAIILQEVQMGSCCDVGCDEGRWCIGHDGLAPATRLHEVRSRSDQACQLVSSLSDTPTIVLNDKVMREIASSVVTKAILPRVQPSDTLYLIFTSCSTSTPKGAQISHSNVCSALRYQR